jgi:hypothetical protein
MKALCIACVLDIACMAARMCMHASIFLHTLACAHVVGVGAVPFCDQPAGYGVLVGNTIVPQLFLPVTAMVHFADC